MAQGTLSFRGADAGGHWTGAVPEFVARGEKSLGLREKAQACVQAGELADEHDQVRKQDAGVTVPVGPRINSLARGGNRWNKATAEQEWDGTSQVFRVWGVRTHQEQLSKQGCIEKSIALQGRASVEWSTWRGQGSP